MNSKVIHNFLRCLFNKQIFLVRKEPSKMRVTLLTQAIWEILKHLLVKCRPLQIHIVMIQKTILEVIIK